MKSKSTATVTKYSKAQSSRIASSIYKINSTGMGQDKGQGKHEVKEKVQAKVMAELKARTKKEKGERIM